MMRSLYAGVTGLRNHQTRMDVIGNNIANVNTVGFKASRTVFQDLYSQSIGTGSRNSYNATGHTGRGGTNPMQIGLGVTLSAIDVIHTPGANEYTGRGLDVALNGDGFFVIDDGKGGKTYTRAGNFYIDDKGYLVTKDGQFVARNASLQVSTGADPTVGGEMGLAPLPNTHDNYTISRDGLISAINKTTGDIEYFGYIMTATFYNPNGLEKIGGNYYQQTPSSGTPHFTTPGAGDGVDLISVGSLEMSNVDLGQEFVNMIVTQRGFQANSRTITTSDQMLEELVNLKR